MKLREDEVRVPAPDGEIRAVLIGPVGDGPWPGVLLYTDIFQLTESTLRTARRLAAAGFLVCVPEIYPHGDAGRRSRWSSTTPASRPGWPVRRRPRPPSSTPTGWRCSTS